jgi:hypothetical protein
MEKCVVKLVYDRVSHIKLLTIFSLNCVIFMRALLKLNLLVRTLTIGSIKPLLRNLVNPLMIALLSLTLL